MDAENLVFTATRASETVTQRFDALMAQHGASLLRLAGGYTNTAGDREDLFQDIALSIWQALPSFRGESSERTFIFRVAHNRAIAHAVRTRKKRTEEADKQTLPDLRPNPEQELAREQQRARLLTAIRQLPADYRRVMILVLEGLTHNEVAEILGLQTSNVAVRVNRAKQMLRDLLKEKS